MDRLFLCVVHFEHFTRNVSHDRAKNNEVRVVGQVPFWPVTGDDIFTRGIRLL